MTTDAPPREILIVRCLPGLGDFLCAVPAWRALRQQYPAARISLLGLPAARALVDRFSHLLDRFIEFPGYPGLPEQPPDLAGIPEFLRECHAARFDLALQMHGSGAITNPLTMLLGARHTAGFYLPDQYCPDPARFALYPDDLPEVRRHLRLMEHLQIRTRGEDLEFPINIDDCAEAHAMQSIHDVIGREYVCIHAGASDPAKCWSPAKFARVADWLAERGLKIVLTGTVAERSAVDDVMRQMRQRAVNLTGQTGLGVLAALLSEARCLICNDTGTSHLAAAVGCPSVIVFSATDPARWAPLNAERHRAVWSGSPADARSLPLQPLDMERTLHVQRAQDRPPVSVDQVLEAVDEILKRE